MPVDVEKFLEAAALAARQVGIMAKRLQGQVKNEGKEINHAADASDHVRRMTEAKTAVDEISQDIIITALLPHLPVEETVLDAEEDTPGKALLPAQDGKYVLVLDPIDGTLVYLEGGNTYSVNIGLFSEGKVVAALLYYPVLDVAYFTPGHGAYVARQFEAKGLATKQEINFAPQPVGREAVYIYRNIRAEIKPDIVAAGYKAVNSVNGHARVHTSDPTESLYKGEIIAALPGGMQVRDIMHGAVLTCAEGGYMRDWLGNPVGWPLKGGALGKVVISGWPLPQSLQDILKQHA